MKPLGQLMEIAHHVIMNGTIPSLSTSGYEHTWFISCGV